MNNYLVKRLIILLVVTIFLFIITLVGFLKVLTPGEIRFLNENSVSENVFMDIKENNQGDDKYIGN